MSDSRMDRLAPHPAQVDPDSPPPADAIATMIATKRRRLGWSLARVARQSELRSPAYVFHIENGSKVPSESVARRIARALGLDPELLAAWSRARGRTDLSAALDAARTLAAALTPALTNAPPPLAASTPASAPRQAAPGAGAADLLVVPLLPEGFDPSARADDDLPALDTLRLDRRLFPPLAAIVRPIAYRLSAHGARGIPDVLAPGDCVVISRDGEPPVLDAPTALRAGARVEIARWRGAHLPPRGGAPDSDRPSDAHALEAVVGRVVVAFRRWL